MALLPALLSCLLFQPAAALTIKPLDDRLLLVTTTSQGQTRDEAIRRAQTEAVRASAGRVLLADQLLLADELLTQYLDNYYATFISGTEITSDSFEKGQNVLSFNIFVDYQKLEADLKEKMFLYQPAPKPAVAVFLSESLGEETNADGVAREILIQALRQNALKPFEGNLVSPPPNTDVGSDEFLLKSGLITSQRNGVEILVTGSARTRLVEQRPLYYDQFFFYTCDLTVKMIRVDTGLVMGTVTATGSAAGGDRAEAIRIAIERAAADVGPQLAKDYQAYWPVVVQGRAQYQVLLTSVNEELLRIVMQHLDQLGKGTRVHLRKMFDSSALLVVETQASREDFLSRLASSPYPTLTVVNPEAASRFEVQVGG